MEEVLGVIETITFSNQDTGFTVASILCSKTRKKVVLVGTMPSIQVGQSIQCSGTWKFHAAHGRQFEVESFSMSLPQDVRSIEKFLSSGAVSGIGPVFAKKLVEKFGPKTLEVLDSAPHRLSEITGIGKKKIEKALSSWQDNKSFKELCAFMQSYGISIAYAKKILRTYGHFSIQKIKENPYQLAKEIRGIGFLFADKIAKEMKIANDSDVRLEAGVDYVLYELSQDGHTCFPLSDFLDKATKILDVEKELLRNYIVRLVQNQKVKVKSLDPANPENELMIWSNPLYFSEVGIASEISRLMTSPQGIRSVDTTKASIWAEEKLHIQFAPKQIEAIVQVLEKKLSIITGGPGTGKSTITKALVRIFEKLTPKIILCAPTGRAAKRLQEITYKYASTLHRLLKFNFEKGTFTYDRENPLDCDVVIIDESSMIDTLLMYQFLKAIPSHAKVCIIGDVNQLPSVGAGTVLKDLINSNSIPVARLDVIFRQAQYSKIIVNAHRINSGEIPSLQYVPESDFQFIESETPQDILKRTVELVTKSIPEKYGYDSKKDIQVLVPMRRGGCGIDAFNEELQKHYSKGSFGLTKRFYVGDKVMQTRNNYKKDVFNGDIGIISNIDYEDETVTVQMDEREVVYEGSEDDELVLAYAVSVHKYQGSECPCVIVPVHTSHFMLLTKNLLYTAVTRGKKLVILIGIKKAVAMGVKNQNNDLRFTGLKASLSDNKAT